MADEQQRASLGEEAARLVGAVQDWTRQNFPAGPDGHMGAECQWCPLCQFMAVLRGERPEVTARVAEAGSALAGAFRALVDATTAAPAGDGAAREGTPEPPPRVQRIDLRFGADPEGSDADSGDEAGTGSAAQGPDA